MENVAPAPATPASTLVGSIEGAALKVGAALVDAAAPAAAGALSALEGGAGTPAAIAIAEKVGASALGITPERLQLAIVLTQTLTSLVPAADRAAIAKSVHAAFAELVHAV